MLLGAEDLKKVCQRRIDPAPHRVSGDGRFSWEEVECLGACVNAPMVQIGKDTYEDLTPESLAEVLDEIAAGRKPTTGPQNGRTFSAPLGWARRVSPIHRSTRASAPSNASISPLAGQAAFRRGCAKPAVGAEPPDAGAAKKRNK